VREISKEFNRMSQEQAEIWLSSIASFGEDPQTTNVISGEYLGNKKSSKGTSHFPNKSSAVSRCEKY
jgi:hypothetical protein